MGKGIILRVLEGTVLTPVLSRALGELLPGFKLEYYQEKPDYKRSIERRINSLYDAFIFNLDAYPLDPKFTSLSVSTLKSYAAECKAACNLSKSTPEELHKELELFTARLLDALVVSRKWHGDPLTESIACLNEAEQYDLMRKGRYDLVTLTQMDLGPDTKYVLQLDESLPPYYDQWLDELERIKLANYPKTPSWFYELPEYQQAYFCNLGLKSKTPANVIQDINTFLLTWKGIKKATLNLNIDLAQIQKKSPPLPIWFKELSPHIKEMITVLSEDPGTLDQKLKSLKHMVTANAEKQEFKENLENIATIPQWYWVLSNMQQYFLEYVLKTALTVKEAVSFLSSRHRTLPAPANFAAHSLLKINESGEVSLFYDKRIRSSHVATRDGLEWAKAVQMRHVDSNLDKVMEHVGPKQKVLVGTLISPITAAEYIPSVITDYVVELPPDLKLHQILQAAIARRKNVENILPHNHPYNFAKLYYWTTAENEHSKFILDTAQEYVATTPGLEQLLKDYRNTLNSPMLSATVWDYNGREVFLSSLEELIILNIGGRSYGSCVSGKDRKAIQLIHTDAMILYKEKYGFWPQFNIAEDHQDRINFVNIVVDLYLSYHQHEHAGQNAPGSEGIKTPNWYWPKDISAAINKRLGTDNGLVYDNRKATDNEVRYISKKFRSLLSPEHELYCTLIARQIGEKDCTGLYDALTPLLNEESRFIAKNSWGLFSAFPKGIANIRSIVFSKTSGDTNIERMSKIFAEVLRRPESDASRTPATLSVYGRMQDLLQPIKPETTLEENTKHAIEEWTSLFQQSKLVNSSSLVV